MPRRSHTLLLIAVALAASACTPTGSSDTSAPTTVADPTTSVPQRADDTTTTTDAGPTTTLAPLSPPEVADKREVALDAFVEVDGYNTVAARTPDDYDLFASFDAWVPQRIIDGLAAALVVGPDGQRVALLSTIPVTGFRGDPNVPAIYALSAGRDEFDATVVDGITTIDTGLDGSFEIWSDGDGVLIATSQNAADAHSYMVERAAIDSPNTVWEPESCLYLAPSDPPIFGVYPYAPFPKDLVVPCDGPHNAEVILAEATGTSLTAFDAEAIHYERNYECDRAYVHTFGANVKERRPSLITYMPDEDEWDRGDRYLACVTVLLDRDGDPVLIDGSMATRQDLAFALSARDCTDGSTSNVIDCGSIHSQQYVGAVTFESDVYPSLGDDAFDDLCSVYLHELANGAADLVVTGLGLMPYSFELGDREVRCYASAIVDGFLPVNIVGSFYDTWTVVDENVTSA